MTTGTNEKAAKAEIASTQAPANSEVVSNLETANLIEGYHVIAEWIRFADAKAAVVLTVGGAIAGLVIPTLKIYLEDTKVVHPAAWWTIMVSSLFAVWLFLVLLSGVCAFQCIIPFRQKGRHPALEKCKHFHPAAIAAAFRLEESDRFIEGCEKMGDGGLRKEVAACLLIDSHISSAKYLRVTRSIRLMGASALVALAYLIAIQF